MHFYMIYLSPTNFKATRLLTRLSTMAEYCGSEKCLAHLALGLDLVLVMISCFTWDLTAPQSMSNQTVGHKHHQQGE